MRAMQRLLRVQIKDSNGMTVFMVLCWCGQFKQTRPTVANTVAAVIDTTNAAECNELCDDAPG